MNLIVLQQGGLGDIFFIQKLCKVLSRTYEVYHPVTPEMWNSGASQLITNVHCGVNLQLPTENAIIYDCSNQPKPNGSADIMTSKYSSCPFGWQSQNQHPYRTGETGRRPPACDG